MKVIKVKLAALTPSDINIRMHPARQIKEYIRSVQMFGQIRPIVIDENNVIIAGNGLYTAMKEMGLDSAECYPVKELTKKQKEKLMLADNKVYELGAMDNSAFDKILKDLEGDLDVPGWDEDLLRTITASANQVAEEINSYGTFDERTTEPIRKNEERREGTEALTTEPFEQTEQPPEAAQAPSQETTQPAEQGRYIVCPKCGEKIWL